MKKRLLSAFLALAMVLTLLPVSAFASAIVWTTQDGDNSPVGVTYSTGSGASLKTDNKYYDTVTDANGNTRVTKTVTVTLCTGGNAAGQKYGHWYWQKNQGNDSQAPKYMEIQSGIIASTGTSGQWYPDIRTATVSGGEQVTSGYTVLGSGVTMNLSTYKNTSLTLVIAGSVGALTIPNNLTQLNISGKHMETSTNPGVMAQGSVNAIYTDRDTQVAANAGTNTGLTVTADNINITSVTLNGRANTLSLTNCNVGAIQMDGAANTTLGAAAGTPANSWGAQTITAKSSTITSIAITNANGGGIDLQDTTVSGTVGFTSDGGNIQVKGLSSTGVITVGPRTPTGQYARVNISGGSVGGVTQITDAVNGTNGNQINITVTGTSTNFGTINADIYGAVSITDANGDAVTVDKGTLSFSGSGVDVTGNVTMGTDGPTTLSMGATKSTFGGIVAGNGANLTINSWEGKRWDDGGNKYGTLDLGTYTGKKVTGGTFSKSTNFEGLACLPWLATANIQFCAEYDGNRHLYNNDELAQAIADLGRKSAIGNAGAKLFIVGMGSGAPQNLILKNGQNVLASIAYNDDTPMVLPEQVNGMTISSWFVEDNRNTSFPAGTRVNVPFTTGSDLTLNCTATSTGVTKITKASVRSVASTDGTPVVNQNVTVTLNGNTLNVTGAVNPNGGGLAVVKVDLETDAVDNSGQYIVLEQVRLDYDVNTKKISFNPIQPESVLAKGALVQDGMLVLNNGTGEKYTVTATVNESAPSLGIAPDSTVAESIVVTFGGKLANWTSGVNGQKENLTNKLAGTGSSFTYGANQAMQQAINAAQATITSDTTVKGWIKTAQTTIWRQGFKSPVTTENTNYGYMPNLAPNTGNFDTSNSTSATTIRNTFSKAYIVPYLVVNVTDYDPAGTMTATLTPYFRVDVSGASYDAKTAYTVQQGRALTLTGDIASDNVANQVKVKFGNALESAFATQSMHQDGKYVYTGVAKEWMISHIGANGSLGSIVINSDPGLVTIDGTAADAITRRAPSLAALGCAYDSLQAAIDDTVRGTTIQTDASVTGVLSETMDTVVINGKYTGSSAITMTGIARKVKVIANGQSVTASGSNVSVDKIGTQVAGGYIYAVELKQDTVTASGDNVLVNGNAGGTVTVSTKKASAGQTVTVTVTPNAGYTVTGVTVRTDSGTNVSVSGSGTNYTFVMPSGAKTVTVTPTFNQPQTAASALVTVGNPSSGSGQAVTSAGANRVTPGTYVTVTTSPSAGQRTMGVSISTNGAAANAVRTGVNTFGFTVPANATNVVVTPVFDSNNGTNFSDVWSNAYYSNAVAWAVSKNVTSGTSTYEFSPTASCTRAQMVTFLWRAAGSPAVPTGTRNPFWDVKVGEYYYNAVLWAVSKGITNGVSANEFGINQTVTRAQAVTFLYRYNNSPAVSGNSGFSDVPSNEYYSRAVAWAAKTGVTNGTTPTTFSPNQACQRCQIVTFLYNDMVA